MIRKIIRLNSVIMVLLVAFFLIYPAVRAMLDIRDPALRQPGTPKAAWRLYRNLTPRYARWAKERVAQGQAEALSIGDISGTEWPLFGSAFYLWGIENLQASWDAGDHTADIEPKVFARDAIIAASELVIDPRHASWVKKHWGENYLHRENVFYRMLVIGALTSREKVLHDGFIRRALRGFTEKQETRYHLPPYAANADTGAPASDARGCANSYMAITAPELWPAQAKLWYSLYDASFWQKRITAVGYREYPKDDPNSDWSMDVDAGPVIAGHGVAANAFGIGAARKNGRFDRAYPLAAEMLATIGELPNGELAIPRLLSNLSDAPMLGESAILWQLSIQPEKGFAVKSGGSIPTYVYIVLGTVLLFGVWRILHAVETFRETLRPSESVVQAPRFQTTLWAVFMLAAVIAISANHELIGIIFLVAGAMLPVTKKMKTPKGIEDWPEAKPSTEGA